jgi:hypothetical protein
MTVLIQLTTVGVDTGPLFDLYSNLDGYLAAFEVNITTNQLLLGFTSVNVPDGTTIIKVLPHGGICTTPLYLEVVTTTTTTSSTTSTSTSTTTSLPETVLVYNITKSCGDGCILSYGDIRVNTIPAYTWTGATSMPKSGIISATLGDTIIVNATGYAVPLSPCVGENAIITIYINGILAATGISSLVTYTFEYVETTTIWVELTCSP